MKKEYSFKEIKSILPYDYPFLFIDRVVLVEANKKIICTKNVSGNEYYFAGHFKDDPVLPGVILIEAMSQAAYLLGRLSEKKKNIRYYLGGIQSLKFFQPVYPGQQLIIEAEKRIKIKKAELIEARAFVGSSLVCRGGLMMARL